MPNDEPQPSRTRRLLALLHRWVITKPLHRPAHHLTSAIIALIGLGCLVLVVLALVDPAWEVGMTGPNYGRSDLPPLGGVSLHVVPAGLLGLVAYRVWWALALDLEAWKQRRRRSRAQPGE